MTTCKDCVHFKACKNIYEIHGDGLSEESYGCDQFSNRSRTSIEGTWRKCMENCGAKE